MAITPFPGSGGGAPSESQVRTALAASTATVAVNGQTVSNCAGVTRTSGNVAVTATSGDVNVSASAEVDTTCATIDDNCTTWTSDGTTATLTYTTLNLRGSTTNVATVAGNVCNVGNTTGATVVSGSTTSIRSAAAIGFRPTGVGSDLATMYQAGAYARLEGMIAIGTVANNAYALCDGSGWAINATTGYVSIVGSTVYCTCSNANGFQLGDAVGARQRFRTPAAITTTATTANQVLDTILIVAPSTFESGVRRIHGEVIAWRTTGETMIVEVDQVWKNVGGVGTLVAAKANVTSGDALGTAQFVSSGTGLAVACTPAAATSTRWVFNGRESRFGG